MRIWQISNDTDIYIGEETGNCKEGDPLLKLHSGTGTLHDSQTEGDRMAIIFNEPGIPDPLLVTYRTPPFGQADILPSDAPGLIVTEKLIQFFSTELQACCREYQVRTVSQLPTPFRAW